ncbi:hypothetical protein [Polaromonas sp. CG9_12]|nr:hypothetical protein [Polaromonas sp. CG9_12]
MQRITAGLTTSAGEGPRPPHSSRGRGTGSARAQAQRPPRGAGSCTQRTTVGARHRLTQAGAAGLAPPDRRRSGPLGGQGAARSERPWGQGTALLKQGPRDWLRQTAGAAAPSGGRELRAANDRGGKAPPYSSRGRGTGSARPQAQRPPRGAGSYAQRTTVGARHRLTQAGAAGLAPPDRRRSGPLGGQEAARSERPWGQGTALLKQGPRDWLRQTAGAAAPSGGRKLHAANDRGGKAPPYSSRGRGTGSARPQAQRPPRGAGSYAQRTTVGARHRLTQAGAAGLAPPDRRRSGPLGGQGVTRSERPWGQGTALLKQGPRDWLRQTAGAAAPSGGRKLHAANDRGGKAPPYSSRGRGTGSARPQAQRPPRGAGSYAQRTTVGARHRLTQAGAAGLAPPDRRRSSPLGGQGVTRSERPWGLIYSGKYRGRICRCRPLPQTRSSVRPDFRSWWRRPVCRLQPPSCRLQS